MLQRWLVVIIGLPLLLAALTLAGAGLWWGNYTLSVEEYAFSSSRLPPGWDGGRLVVLSDLHGRQFGRDNRCLAAAVEAAHPDVIALVGDFVDEWTDPAYLRPLLERLTALAPCYFVSGNHEWAAGKMQETAALLADCGVTWLHNDFVTLQRGGDSLLLAGIDDPNGYADQKTPEELAADPEVRKRYLGKHFELRRSPTIDRLRQQGAEAQRSVSETDAEATHE